jgi:hypothetical protein
MASPCSRVMTEPLDCIRERPSVRMNSPPQKSPSVPGRDNITFGICGPAKSCDGLGEGVREVAIGALPISVPPHFDFASKELAMVPKGLDLAAFLWCDERGEMGESLGL